VGEKTNEIPELPHLLSPLPIEGAVVTADALHAQKETFAKTRYGSAG